MASALLVAALFLLAANAPAQYAASASATGPNGGPSARPGDRIEVRVHVASYCEFDTAVSVSEVSLVIHHGNGDVTVSNLVDEPVFLWQWGDSAVFTTNFVARCEDPDILAVSSTVRGMIHWGFITGAPAGGFTAQFGAQIAIVPDVPPLTITRTGPTTVQVSWPESPCYRLETCEAMDGQWQSLPAIPALVEGANSITFNTAGRPQNFFRLAKH